VHVKNHEEITQLMEQFKQYGIITILGIALFGVMYSSIEILDWQFFPYLQIGILSLLTLVISLIQYFHKENTSPTFIYATWVFLGLEWMISIILLNQPSFIMDYFQLIFLPLIYYVYYALWHLYLIRNEKVVKWGRILFYLLLPSTLNFFILPNAWSALGMEVLFSLYLGLLLLSKPISSPK
jgi:hypothetical protein